MKIGFPPERVQPPPHYRAGPRSGEVAVERAVVRAVVHPDAIRIAAPPSETPRSSTTPCEPHAISFDRVRPPPGTVVVAAAPRVVVRAIVHPDATRTSSPRAPVERHVTAAVAPHRIAFGSPTAPPYEPAG